MTAQLPSQDVSGDDQTHLDAAQMQIFVSYYYTHFVCVIDTRRH
jgi:hypothetical protein